MLDIVLYVVHQYYLLLFANLWFHLYLNQVEHYKQLEREKKLFRERKTSFFAVIDLMFFLALIYLISLHFSFNLILNTCRNSLKVISFLCFLFSLFKYTMSLPRNWLKNSDELNFVLYLLVSRCSWFTIEMSEYCRRRKRKRKLTFFFLRMCKSSGKIINQCLWLDKKNNSS